MTNHPKSTNQTKKGRNNTNEETYNRKVDKTVKPTEQRTNQPHKSMIDINTRAPTKQLQCKKSNAHIYHSKKPYIHEQKHKRHKSYQNPDDPSHTQLTMTKLDARLNPSQKHERNGERRPKTEDRGQQNLAGTKARETSKSQVQARKSRNRTREKAKAKQAMKRGN
ncbi:hypothetical protein M404DRAFT_10404 [Pisolithus tinctorius Marx 270]|uniref:Uncharacterized protein n=1 Tax=Pisolithus tinctorius Marx 270 TaxID=870435 RepID=A0A0C3JPL2_PISTI|nr:hypothetical protein M404DRAFT_10404 [Pisolithus tinctorius Marx 270]